MSVQPARKNGKPGYRWGSSGKVYTYKPGDKAAIQGAAIKARQGRE